jgi:ribosomal protein L14E/L6E/L27E
MNLHKADIVQSLAGHDKGEYFFVMDLTEEAVLIADGKRRTSERPKRKNRKHVRKAARIDSLVVSKIHSGDKVLNSELRKALAEFRQSASHNQGGY